MIGVELAGYAAGLHDVTTGDILWSVIYYSVIINGWNRLPAVALKIVADFLEEVTHYRRGA